LVTNILQVRESNAQLLGIDLHCLLATIPLNQSLELFPEVMAKQATVIGMKSVE
jgi:hypothetical protein